MEGEEPCGSCLNCRSEEKMAAIELLDELWFHHNMLLNGVVVLEEGGIGSCREMEVKNHEGLTSSTATDHGAPKQELGEEISSLVISNPDHDDPHNKTDVPSLKDQLSLQRAPSLPSYMGEEKLMKEMETSENGGGTKPLLQRSLSSFDASPSIPSDRNDQPFNKSFRSRPNIPRRPLRRGMSGDLRPLSQSWSRKSLSDLEEEEVQGFRDLGFTFNKEDVSPSLLVMIPGLQEKKEVDDQQVKRPYLSEAWMVQRPSPPTLNWPVERSSGLDMKEQLRMWARNVASNCNVDSS